MIVIQPTLLKARFTEASLLDSLFQRPIEPSLTALLVLHCSEKQLTEFARRLAELHHIILLSVLAFGIFRIYFIVPLKF